MSHLQKYLSGGINISKYVVREFRRVWEQDIKYRRYICRPRYKHQVDQLREKLKGYGYTVEELAEELECSEQDIQTALEGRDVRCLNIRQRLKHILRREQRLEKFREELLTPYYTHNSNGGER